MFQAAFYKDVRPGIEGIYSRVVRWWTRTPYSHCEFLFQDGMQGSSSYIDGGVRIKNIVYDPGRWDFIDLPDEWEADIRNNLQSKVGMGYDLLGNFGFIIPQIYNTKNKYFCSEIIAELLGFEKAYLFSPGILYYSLKLLIEKSNKINQG